MTNNLTDGMSRLSEEISALRHNRAALNSDLVLERANLGNTCCGNDRRFSARPGGDGGENQG